MFSVKHNDVNHLTIPVFDTKEAASRWFLKNYLVPHMNNDLIHFMSYDEYVQRIDEYSSSYSIVELVIKPTNFDFKNILEVHGPIYKGFTIK